MGIKFIAELGGKDGSTVLVHMFFVVVHCAPVLEGEPFDFMEVYLYAIHIGVLLYEGLYIGWEAAIGDFIVVILCFIYFIAVIDTDWVFINLWERGKEDNFLIGIGFDEFFEGIFEGIYGVNRANDDDFGIFYLAVGNFH